jgi:enoyl-CoA hydratase/carnithine racemase
MAYETILYDVKDRIATITLNRPDRLNAYNDKMASDIRKAMAEAANDAGVRVVILTGRRARHLRRGATSEIRSRAAMARTWTLSSRT